MLALTEKLIVAAIAASLLGGCTALKQATGQIDSTTLPGQRENILPPDQQQARDPAVTGQPLPPDPTAAKNTVPQVAANNAKPMAPMSKGTITDVDSKSAADCDPKVDLCPQTLQPEPLPPPSPLKAEAPAKGKMAMAKGAKSVAKTPMKKVVKKKKVAAEVTPPEPKDDPPPPGPADTAPKPQGQ